MSFKILSLFFLIVLLVPLASAHEVEKTWDGEYYQEGIVQLVIHGDKNQSNISCTVKYYYIENPLSENESIVQEALKGFKVPQLDENGTGLFEFVLNKSNGFERIGGYNLSFYFGEDLLNETGIEYYTAPRAYVGIMVNLNLQVFINANKQNNQEVANTVNVGVSQITKTASDLYLVIVIGFFLCGLFVFNWLWEKKYYETFITSFLKVLKKLWLKYRGATGSLDDILNSTTSTEAFRRIWRNLNNQIGDNDMLLVQKKKEVAILESKLNVWNKDEKYIKSAILRANPNDPHLKNPIVIFRESDGSIRHIKEGKLKTLKKLPKYTKVKKSRKGVGVND